MAEADKIATGTVRMPAVINSDGTLKDCPYCNQPLKLRADSAQRCKLVIVCSSEQCSGMWMAVPTLIEEILNGLQDDSLAIDITRIPFIKLILDPGSYNDLFDHYTERHPWIKRFMEAKGWCWICVCAGDVVAGSESLDDYPTMEQRLTISTAHQGMTPVCIDNTDLDILFE